MTATILLMLEITGVVFGLLYVIGAVNEKWWCWPFGIMNVIAYGVSMYFSKMYGESILQVLYFILSIYGWLNWQKKGAEVKVSSVSSKELLITVLVSLFLFVVFYKLLVFWGGDLPFWDALTNGFAIGATYLVARKKIENWIFWIYIDLALTAILFYKGMYFYSFLYVVFTVFALAGWFEWKRKLSK